MEKKLYITPNTDIVEMDPTSLMEASIELDPSSDPVEDASIIGSRELNDDLWED
jgi:hypothetical protein